MKINKNKLVVLFASLALAACAPSKTPESSAPAVESTTSEINDKTSETKTSEAPVTSETKTSDTKTSETKTSETRTSETRTSETKTSEVKTSAPTPENPVDKGTFVITTDLTETKTIHTERQTTYLNYSGDYSKIPATSYPDGKEFISDPNSVALAWTHTPASGKTVKNYAVRFGQAADLAGAYEVKGTTATNINLINVWLGTNYFRVVAYYTDGTSAGSDIMSFKVDETAPRNLKIEGLTNCRDLGGRKTEDGGVIKQGLLYRTSGNNFQTKSSNTVGKGIITDAGKVEMTEHLKMKTEINVNNSTSYNLKLNGTTVKDFYMDYGGSAAHHFSRNAESVKDYFEEIAKPTSYPAFFHCRIGTDRTGLCGILTNGLLGVPLNEIYQDYLFSNFGNIEEKRYIGSQAGQDNIENYVNQILEMDGETFKNKTYNMLLACGLSRDTLDAVINNLTEGTKAKNNDAGQVALTADKLTLENGQALKKGDGSRNNPDSYVVLNSSSKGVSVKVNAEKAFKGQIVAYLGHNDYSSTKKIERYVSTTVNGSPITVKSQTFQQAGMGNVSNRTNYYPVILGTYDFPAGESTVKVLGSINSDPMNLGTLCVFGAGSSTTSTGGGTTTTDPVTPPASDSTSYELAIEDTVDGLKTSSDRFTKNGNPAYATWNLPADIKAGTYTLALSAKLTQTNNSDHNNQTISDKYNVEVDGVKTTLTTSAKYGDFWVGTGFQYGDIVDVDIPAGAKQIKLNWIGSGYTTYVSGIKLTSK